MKENKTKNTERGIINPNGIIIDGDIALSTGLDPGKDRALILRTLLCMLASYFTMSILCSFLKADAITVFPAICTALSFGALCSKNGMFKIFGIGYFIFQITYFVIIFDEIINGFYIALDKYMRLADISHDGIEALVRKIDPKELDYDLFHFLLFLTAIVSTLVALACIVRLDFPIFFISTFPFLEIGLYHGWEPPTLQVIGLVVCWITVLSVTIINHSTNKAGVNNTFAVHRRKKAYFFTSKKLKNRFFTFYITGVALLCAAVFAMSVLFSAVTGFVRPKAFEKLRHDITEAVNDFSIDKIADLFDKLKGGPIKEIGPTSGGKLGERDGIKFDNKTALNIQILNNPAYSLYLKGYVAGDYSDNEWNPIEDELPDNVREAFDTYAGGAPIQNFNNLMYTINGNVRKENIISVAVVEADDRFAYAPYMSDYLSANTFGPDKVEAKEEGSVKLNDDKYQITFLDMSILGNDWCNNGIIDQLSYSKYSGNPLNEAYSAFVKDHYTNVAHSPGLDNVIEQIRSQLYLGNTESYGYNGEMVLYNVVKKYFDQNFKYDLNPGKTPDGKDFIDYFLSEQKKGYCSYFATAGTMLMRAFGYPARYVEGFIITPKEYKSENGKLLAAVTDKAAHAWCEVFIDSVGWVPLEFTPGYQQGGNPNKTPQELNRTTTASPATTTTTTTTTSSSKPVSGTTKAGQSVTTTKPSDSGSGGNGSWSVPQKEYQTNKFISFIEASLVYVLILIVFIVLFYIRRRLKLRRQKKLINQEDYSQAVLCIYVYYLKYLSLIGISDDSNISDEAQAKSLISKCRKNGIEEIIPDITKLSSMAIEVLMSKNTMTFDERYFAVGLLDKLKTEIVPLRLSFFGKLAARWFYGLY